MSELKQFAIIEATIKHRPSVTRGDGVECPLRDDVGHLEGKRFRLSVDYQLGPDDMGGKYDGEWALSSFDHPNPLRPLIWIASGDVTDIASAEPNLPEEKEQP